MSALPTATRRNGGSRAGQGLVVLGYVLHGIRRHKRRSISLLLGVMIGVALVSSVFVWTDTGALVAIDDYFAGNVFHYFCYQRSHPSNDPNAIYPVQDWVDQQESTESTHVVYQSRALLEQEDRDPSEIYSPYPYLRGIKDCAAFFADNNFLADAERAFIYTGRFELGNADVLVSQRVVDDAEMINGLSITVGSVINVAIARDYPAQTFGGLDLIYFDVQVVGIYETEPKLDALRRAFPSFSRKNWGPESDAEVVFGWLDSIILPKSLLSRADLDVITLHVDFPRLLVSVNPEAFHATGLDKIPALLESLFFRIESGFDVFLGGRESLLSLQRYVAAYHQRLSMGILVAPMVILSVLLTTFATTIFLTGRRAEIGILRSRGASYRQLYSSLVSEFLFLTTIGLILGGFVGIIVGCFIPAATGFLEFDIGLFLRFFGLAELRPEAWLTAGLVCLVPSALIASLEVRSFLKTELYQAIRGTVPRLFASARLQAIYVFGVCVLVLPFTLVVVSLPSSPDVALSLFIAAVILWVFLCDAGARLLRPSVAGFSRLFRPLFGEKSKLFAKSVRVRRGRIIPLLIILTLTFSVTIFSAVEAQTYKTNLDTQIDYFVGGDIRIHSGLVAAQRTNELELVPGIGVATPFIEVKAAITGGVYVAGLEFSLIGVNPLAYAECGKWQPSSVVDQSPESLLAALAANPDGIILPQQFATYFDVHAGDSVTIFVWDQNLIFLEAKVFDVVGEMYSAPGFGYANPSDQAAPNSPVPGFGFQRSRPFAFCHQDYFLVEVPSWKDDAYVDKTHLFIASLASGADSEQTLQQVQALDFASTVWSPRNFNLQEIYPDGYLFRQGVISLLSVGFVAALTISVIALTVFVNAIVAERRTEYAVMRALGGTRRQVTIIVLGEFLGLILASFLLSLLLGLGFSWLLMYNLLKLFPQPYIVPFTMAWPHAILLTVLGLVVLAMLTSTYIPARRAGAVQVHNLLRNL
jgi:ABC-type antimicrobial peptide transport system permease subunit